MNINDYLRDGILNISNFIDLKILPDLPEGIKEIYCYSSGLVKLPKLPQTLTHLYCDNNKLTELPELPKELIELQCYDNNLKTLPKLPETLKYLYCSLRLSDLPKLPESTDLWCLKKNGIVDIIRQIDIKEHNKKI